MFPTEKRLLAMLHLESPRLNIGVAAKARPAKDTS